MEYRKEITEIQLDSPTVISFGKFDGLHRGHGLLMDYMLEKKKSGLKTVVFTFDIPPKSRADGQEYKLITTNEERRYLFERLGVDYLIECPFTEHIMCMEPAEFIRKIVKRLCVKSMVTGSDFHFGYKRAGDYHTLQEYAGELGYEVAVMDKIQEHGRDISSTYVREELAAGHIRQANRLLGYPFFVQGVVRHGNHIGGPVLGFPTVNLLPAADKLLPPNGVYLTRTQLDGKSYPGISNVGCKPTVSGEHPVGVETHILGFHREVYGQQIRVEFIEPIREERKFGSLEELSGQLRRDIAAAEAYFSAEPVSEAEKQ